MTLKLLFGAVAVAMLAAGAVAIAADDDEEPPISDKVKKRLAAFERTGETVSCLGLRHIKDIKPLDDYRFLVKASDEYYLNMVSGRCTRAADAFTHLEYSTSLSQLCRNEIINVIDTSHGFFVGGCGLGDFERLEKKEADAE